MTKLENLLTQWEHATANLKSGTQNAFHDVLTLAEQDKIKLVWGADYRDGGACLVNQAGAMLTTGGGHGVPIANFREVVSLFDQINRCLHNEGVNTDHSVSPLAADILLKYYAPLKEIKTSTEEAVKEAMANEAFAEAIYVEPTDEEIAAQLKAMFETEAPVEENSGNEGAVTESSRMVE